VTLRAHVADDARTLLMLVPDGAKAGILERVLEGKRDEAALPAQVARRTGASWLLTRAAAALLTGER
jgi:6-phosphogluconolactonase/glucosamine-6-phosphate isomerase/deaminase